MLPMFNDHNEFPLQSHESYNEPQKIRRDTTASVPLKVPRPRFEGSAPMWPRVPWPRLASPCHCDQWAAVDVHGRCFVVFWGIGMSKLWH